MCYVDECALWVVDHVAVNNSLHHITVAQIESVQRLVEYQQVRVLYERTSQQYKALFSARNLMELPAGQLLDAEQIHPFYAFILFLFVGLVV